MNPFYRTIRTIFRPLLGIWNRLEVRGLEHVPAAGPAIVVANHHSYLDAFVLGAAYPRKIRFMVKRSHFEKTWARWFYWGMDAFAVNQDGRDMDSVREAVRTLKAGGVVGIFPAGERVREPGPGDWKSGVGLLARLSGAPIVPAALRGTFDSFPMGAKLPRPSRVCVVFGEPARYAAGRDREAQKAFLQDLHGRVASMLESGRPWVEPAGASSVLGAEARE